MVLREKGRRVVFREEGRRVVFREEGWCLGRRRVVFGEEVLVF